VNDGERDALLTQIQVQLATITTLQATLAERVSELTLDGRQERHTLFEIVGDLKTRCGELEKWRATERGKNESRGSALSWAKWLLGFAVAAASLILGYLAAK
jgi:hypothetical protein